MKPIKNIKHRKMINHNRAHRFNRLTVDLRIASFNNIYCNSIRFCTTTFLGSFIKFSRSSLAARLNLKLRSKLSQLMRDVIESCHENLLK